MPTDPYRSRQYRDLRAQMRAIWELANAPCWLCGQPIDWDGAPNQSNSFELDHAKSRRNHPELILEPTNARPSHSKCNRSRGTSNPRPGIGQTSETW